MNKEIGIFTPRKDEPIGPTPKDKARSNAVSGMLGDQSGKALNPVTIGVGGTALVAGGALGVTAATHIIDIDSFPNIFNSSQDLKGLPPHLEQAAPAEFIEHFNGTNLLELKDHLEIKAGTNTFPATPDIIKSIIENPTPSYVINDNDLAITQFVSPAKLTQGESMKTDILYFNTAYNAIARKVEKLPFTRIATFNKDPQLAIPVIPQMEKVEVFKIEPRRQGDTFSDIIYKVTTKDAVYGIRVNGVNSRNTVVRPDIDNQIPFLKQGETREEFPLPDQKGLNIPIDDFRTIFTTTNRSLGFAAAGYTKEFPYGFGVRIEALTNNSIPLYLPK